MNKFQIVAALCKNRGIGYKNSLPWPNINADLKHFKIITSQDNSRVIMGKNTWESLPKKPLPKRTNVVITRTPKIKNALAVNTFKDSLGDCNNFVIGGEQLYKTALNDYGLNCTKIHLTEIDKEFKADTFFPKIPGYFKVTNTKKEYDEDNNINLKFKTYENMADLESEEYQYLECMKDILTNGEYYMDRTKTGVISKFDKNLNFTINTLNPDDDPINHKYKIPMLTTKKMFSRGIIEELLWFLRGGVDAKWLQDKNVHIWDGNTSREFLDNSGLNYYDVGEIGPGYGHQWVNWGGNWRENKNINNLIKGTNGINQIKNIIETLKYNPESRRMILTAWNVQDISKMALPPCHMTYIFKVSNHNDKHKKVNCKVLLRSNDMFLGNPFNILSASFLTILIARAANMIPGNVALSICDAHIYSDNVEQVKKQIERVPLKFPTMKLSKDIASWEDMLELTSSDFKIENYYSWSRLNAKMAV